MQSKAMLFLTLVAAALAVGQSLADQATDKKADAKSAAKAQFEMFKKLAGDWSGKGGHEGEDAFDVTVSYKVTSAGSAVMETLFAGTDHEMITMYHLDGDALLLTHYCAAGNQPRMKAKATDNSKKIVFEFLDGTNLDPAKDLFMHDAAIEYVADGHIKSDWTSHQNGKKLATAKFDLKRKQSNAKSR